MYATRKAISIILGLTLAGAGLFGFGHMQFHVVEPVSIKLWLIPITIFAAGVATLWGDFKTP
ncbi:hypothetical protein [Rhizobium chutanense]|uniref:Uncharacterized protein n=1 Tax=Rhizobium chutanense TaxID=2035448 RepID=A0A3S0SZW8_9HYPH|nr:hypothetical protein [Rhizobium chutanense]RUM09268.1 hypothetical protein EFR84_02685 [Rhizobium chutanense]